LRDRLETKRKFRDRRGKFGDSLEKINSLGDRLDANGKFGRYLTGR
jgi:hypothetical protein